jgi:hypothetical protein
MRKWVLKQEEMSRASAMICFFLTPELAKALKLSILLFHGYNITRAICPAVRKAQISAVNPTCEFLRA